MKINQINTFNTPQKTALKTQNKAENNTLKQSEYSSCDIKSNYNLAFMGLFNSTPVFKDARVTSSTIEMVPNKEYLINEDSVLTVADSLIDLSSSEIKTRISALANGTHLIIGREAYAPSGLTPRVSRQHLRISRAKNGQLTACDLGSMNKSKILPNLITPDTSKPFTLQGGKSYVLPVNSYIKINETQINLENYRKEISKLKKGEEFLIGRDTDCQIQVSGNDISRKHASIQKFGNLILVKDLHSTNGTKFIGISLAKNQDFTDDYSNISEIKNLRKGIKTKVPNNSQLYLGSNFTIDLRNKNILELLDEKSVVKIGRSLDCDIIVPEFYACVSREHLILTKVGDEITATDLNSKNATQVVPAKKVKAFYNGANNIQLSQANIGDCYLLSTIYALSRNEIGAQILENMVKVDENGNYIVTFYNRSPILVAPDELDGQKSNEKEKRSVSGDLGVKAIERAYAKMLNHFRNNGQTMFMKIDEGGFPSNALKDLCGMKFKNHIVALTNIPELQRGITVLGRENYIINCTTPNCAPNKKFVDPEKRFIKSHAYSVGNINRDYKTIEIINPHNTKIRDIISWDEFSKYFDNIYVAKTC